MNTRKTASIIAWLLLTSLATAHTASAQENLDVDACNDWTGSARGICIAGYANKCDQPQDGQTAVPCERLANEFEVLTGQPAPWFERFEELTCTDGARASHTSATKSYLILVDKDLYEGRATRVTANSLDTTLAVHIRKRETSEQWLFTTPACGTACGYLLGWYFGSTHTVGGGAGTYEVTVTKAGDQSTVTLVCVD